MAKLKITRATGEVTEHKITPGVEYAFELKYGAGISKMLREHEQQTHIYWLAWECLRRSGAQVPLFNVEFIDSLETVEVLDEEKKRTSYNYSTKRTQEMGLGSHIYDRRCAVASHGSKGNTSHSPLYSQR